MSFPRYPKYKDSGVEWLGQVPDHWDIHPYKRMVNIQNGSDHKHTEQAEGFPVIGSGGVFAYASEFLYDGESVLLGRKGTIDKPLYVTGKFWTVDTMYWTKISSAACGRFAYYTALAIPFDYYSTNTALPSMTKGCLHAHRVTTPSLSEQTAIAAFLDRETAKIDGLVAEQRRLIELLKEKRQAVISHAVTKGLNPNAPMKPSGIEWLGDVPEHWPVPTVHNRYEAVLGKMVDAKKVTGQHPIPYLRNADVGWDEINIENLPIIDLEPDERDRFTVRSGDLLICEGGAGVGQTSIWSGQIEQCGFQKALHRLRPRSEGDVPRYFYYFMRFWIGTGIFEFAKGGSTIPHLTGEALRATRFPCPPRDEQLAIAAQLDAQGHRFDALTEEAERAIGLLQERRTALISAAVTGKIDVREGKGTTA